MKLSVITINWNNRNGLKDTISSVLGQTFQDFEYIVIDGDSSDGSKEVIKSYADKLDYWVSEPDKGIYNAMNKAIKVARGEYCYFLNSGDTLISTSVFEKIFETEIRGQFICGNFVWDRKGVLTTDKGYKDRSWLFSIYDIYSGFLNHQAFFIPTNMFQIYGLYDETLKIMSDWKLFFVAIGIHQEPVSYKDVDIAVYDTTGLSSTIGGKAILSEKRKAAQELLPKAVYEKLDRLYYLDRNGFILDFIFSKKWIHFLFKVFFKLCIMLRIHKVD